jgi:hypothetical protein
MLVAYASGQPQVKKTVDLALKTLGVGAEALFSTLGRTAAKLKGSFPKNIVLWGIQPASLEIGLELSETVAFLLDNVTEKVASELRQWGHVILPKA